MGTLQISPPSSIFRTRASGATGSGSTGPHRGAPKGADEGTAPQVAQVSGAPCTALARGHCAMSLPLRTRITFGLESCRVSTTAVCFEDGACAGPAWSSRATSTDAVGMASGAVATAVRLESPSTRTAPAAAGAPLRNGGAHFGAVEPCSPQPPTHFRCTMLGPDSSYSCLVIHICWNVLSEARMEPPIQAEYLRSGVATTLTRIVDGASRSSSACRRSARPSKHEEPPASTTLA
mmetsp:Transcript_109269/g.308883  ORF Transcript_109269/g.308883 Transcript_109269/m.308883 type:complete len:235 (+) Transcript_109269:1180-1884(+)